MSIVAINPDKARPGQFTAMISSTALDLEKHRPAVEAACIGAGVFPIWMKHLPARDASGVKVSLEMVDQADLYIGVYAWRYGWVPKGGDKSITELEFDHAVQRQAEGKLHELLIFTAHDDHLFPNKAIEADAMAQAKLAAFKTRACDGRGKKDFSSVEELQRLVSDALHEFKHRQHDIEYEITDPEHFEKLHPQPNAFDHQSSNHQWSDLSVKVVSDFLAKARVQIQDDFLIGLTSTEQFRRFKFVSDDGLIPNGAYLCFGDSPSATIHGATTKCYHWKGINRSSGFYDDLESRQGLLQQFEATLGFLTRSLRLERQITDEGRSEVLEIPLDVLQEVVANALVHREYKARSESIMVSVYDDRIEVISPGFLPPPLEIKTINDISTSHPRNSQIARIFYLSGYVERAGSGIERITSSLASRSLPPPLFEQTKDHCFKVTLWRPSQVIAQPTTEKAEASAIPHYLPRLDHFHGREKELTQIHDALRPEKRGWGALIVGPGGIGKTALAVRAASEYTREQFNPVIFVSIKDRALEDEGPRAVTVRFVSHYLGILDEIARALGRDDIPRSTPEDRSRLILDALASTRALLILDSLESLTPEDRESIVEFVSNLPGVCKAILTARRRIGSGINVIELDKLDEAAALKTLADIAEHNKLLARASEDDRRTLWKETAGSPLLLRWTAGQLGRGACRTIPEAIAFLRSCPENNDPLEFIFGDLANEFTGDETHTLCALSYFTLPVKVEHIAANAGLAEGLAETALRSLTNRSLVSDNAEGTHYALAPLVAEFLRKSSPEVVRETGNRLEKRAYALIMECGYDNHALFPKLEAAWPGISPALSLFLTGDNERLQAICTALSDFLNFQGRWDEWLAICEKAEAKAVAAADYANAGWRAYHAGYIHSLRRQADAVLTCADRAAAHWVRSKAGARERAVAIGLRGSGHQLKGNYPAAITAHREALDLHRSLAAESVDGAIGLNDLADAEHRSGDFAAAEGHYREALRVARAVGEKSGVATYTGNLAALALDRKDWPTAESLAREALPLAEAVHRQELIAGFSQFLAKALVRQGKAAEALPHARLAVDIYTGLGSPSLSDAQTTLAECEAAAQ